MLDVEETKEEREEKEDEDQEDVTEKGDQEMIEQMKTMEIMKKESAALDPSVSSTVTLPDIVNSQMTAVEEESEEEATESFENFETTTVIATSISTSEAISYYSSASLPKSDFSNLLS